MKRIVKHTVCASGVLILFMWIFCLPDNLFEGVSYATVVTDRNGELLGARIADDGQWRFPPSDSLPQKFAIALVEFEDRAFYHHVGVNPFAIARAMWQNVRTGHVVSGGSTITMQLARMSRRRPRTVWQKIIEIFMATRIESRYSKSEILRLYAAHAPFGGNVVGIDAAMWRYLGNSGRDLSWAEAATLAVLQNAPSSVHLSRSRDRLLAKRNRLLRHLADKGYLTEDDYNLSCEEPLLSSPLPLPQVASHLVEWYDKTLHGRRVVTSIDLSLQQQVVERTTMWSNELHHSGADDLAAIVVDVHTCDVVAYVGNADMQRSRHGMFVDIARSPRSSGSILKPLLYCAAMHEGTILPTTLLPDLPSDFGGFAPQNFNRQFAGAVPADQAITYSLNVPCVHLLQQYGVAQFVDDLRCAGLTTLPRSADSYGLSLILGGAEITLYDIAMLYARMAQTAQGDADDSTPFGDRVALYHMFNAMYSVERPDFLSSEIFSSLPPIAWKTGTSYGSRDGWAIGVTPDYVVAVWVGNASGRCVAGLTGTRYAGPVMFDIFGLLPSCDKFNVPADGKRVTICRHSGMRAGRNCSDTLSILLPRKAMNSAVCQYCHKVYISEDGTRRFSHRIDKAHAEHWFVLPPVMEHYYCDHHPEYRKLPPLIDGQVKVIEQPMQFIYPKAGSIISIPRQANGERCGVTFSLAHTSPNHTVYWHIDDQYVGATSDIHKITVMPDTGNHRLTVVDDGGYTLHMPFRVV